MEGKKPGKNVKKEGNLPASTWNKEKGGKIESTGRKGKSGRA